MVSTPVTSKSNCIICSYINVTSSIQVGRIGNIEHWYFERVIFPGQRIIFETPSDGILEIYTSQQASTILDSKIPCRTITINT